MAGKAYKAWSVLRSGTPHVICDLGGFAGAYLVAYGAWLIYQPAGFIVGGVLLLAMAMLFGRRLGAKE